MGNMSYCRFENTASDLRDCVDNWDDASSESEQRARCRILKMAGEILEAVGVEYDSDELAAALDELAMVRP